MPKTQRRLLKTLATLVAFAVLGLGAYFLIRAIIALHS